MKIESYVVDIIEGRRKNALAACFLYSLSLGYKLGVKVRNWYYDRFYQTKRVKAPVVSIGNIVAGGSGKTPMVSFLTEKLAPFHEVAILTRGYRSVAEKQSQAVCVSKENEKLCGDEPVWLSRKCPLAQVWVGKDRIASAEKAILHKASLLIMDDGMQHRKLHRDVEIVMMDKSHLFGRGRYLPRGFLRDDPKRLSKADLLVIQSVEEKEYPIVEARVRHFTNAKIVFAKMQMKQAEMLKGKKVGVFCGIARPERFLTGLEQEGIDVVASFLSPDHLLPRLEQLELFIKDCFQKGASAILCTEKDVVKLGDAKFALPIMAIAAELVLTRGEEHMNEIIERLKR